MINGLLAFDIIHILGASIFVFALIYSARAIVRYSKTCHLADALWFFWWAVVSIIIGYKFI
jgi:hypothetical protein